MSRRTPGSANNYAGPRRQVNPVDVPDRDSARVMGHLEGALPRTGSLFPWTADLLRGGRHAHGFLRRLAEAATDHAFKLEGINELPFQLKGSFLFSYF
jgi:hypothetical protein